MILTKNQLKHLFCPSLIISRDLRQNSVEILFSNHKHSNHDINFSSITVEHRGSQGDKSSVIPRNVIFIGTANKYRVARFS